MDATRAIVQAERLTKTYRLFDGPSERVQARLGLTPTRSVAAVSDVSFELPPGRSLGVVGNNGAGKSTLLRLLAGITRPTSGALLVDGRIGAILELGAGFHPELTGRQNIRLSAALAGFEGSERSDLHALTEGIVAFSGLGAFIDEPVKRYSSGMVVRLGFAVATQSAPDVLLVDEALTVGDGQFQKKCIDRIQTFLCDGGTLVLCSHALYYVDSLCDETIWLHEGRVAAHGVTAEVVREYQNHLHRSPTAAAAAPGALSTGAPTSGSPSSASQTVAPSPDASIVEFRMLAAGDPQTTPPTYRLGDRWGVEIECTTRNPDVRVHVAVGVNAGDRREIFACASHRDGLEPLHGSVRYTTRLWVPELPLRGGEFTVHVYLLDENGLHVYEHQEKALAFRVSDPSYSPTLLDPKRNWDWPHG